MLCSANLFLPGSSMLPTTETWMDAAIAADPPGQDGIFTLKNSIKAAPKVFFFGGHHGFTLARVMLNTAEYSGHP